jgi:hypothetical protein
MRERIVGRITLVVVAFGIYRAGWLYGQKQSIDMRGWHSDLCHAYLAEPVVKDKDGNAVNRAQLLDLMIKKALEQPKRQ